MGPETRDGPPRFPRSGAAWHRLAVARCSQPGNGVVGSIGLDSSDKEVAMPRSARPATLDALTRRTFLKGSVAAGAALASGGLFTTALRAAPRNGAHTPIEHILV